MEIFYWEKAFHAGKKIKKNDFAPSEKFSCYAPGLNLYMWMIIQIISTAVDQKLCAVLVPLLHCNLYAQNCPDTVEVSKSVFIWTENPLKFSNRKPYQTLNFSFWILNFHFNFSFRVLKDKLCL